MSASLPFDIPSDFVFDEEGVMRIPMDQAAKCHKTMSDFEREEVLGFMSVSRQLKAAGVSVGVSPRAISKLTLEQLTLITEAGAEDEESEGDES